MAVSTFKYCDQDFFRSVYPDYGKHLGRVHLHNFVEDETLSDRWILHSVGTKPSAVFFDGVEGNEESAFGNVTTKYDWCYVTATDKLYIFVATTNNSPNDDEYIEIGQDKDDFVNQHLVNASMQLNNMLDGRFPRPIPKSFQYASASAGDDTPEYDYILKLMTAKISAVNMIRANDPTSEIASALWDEVTNVEGTGLSDKLNSGDYKLSFEIDKTDDSGDVIEVVKTGTMSLVETYGEWYGSLYDRIKIECQIAGGYSTAKIDVSISDADGLYGTTYEDITVTGGLQEIGLGSKLMVRFEGLLMAEADRFDVIVRSSNLKETNTNTYTVGLYR